MKRVHPNRAPDCEMERYRAESDDAPANSTIQPVVGVDASFVTMPLEDWFYTPITTAAT